MAAPDRLAVEADAARCVALLSVLSRKSLGPEVLRPIEAAATYWAAGDKALANLRLVFSGLPKLRSATDAARVEAAAWCLDQGLAPRDLMKALDLDPSVLDLRKYDPDQPRVPAGSGRESGRWTSDGETGESNAWRNDAARLRPSNSEIGNYGNSAQLGIVPVAAGDPVEPGGMRIVPHTDVDPLDPQGLNAPLSLAEQQAIATTYNMITEGNPESKTLLNPHTYDNRPSKQTGAVLPPSTGGYITFYVRSPGKPAGAQRLVLDRGGQIYYTNNHYLSFYPVDKITTPMK